MQDPDRWSLPAFAPPNFDEMVRLLHSPFRQAQAHLRFDSGYER